VLVDAELSSERIEQLARLSTNIDLQITQRTVTDDMLPGFAKLAGLSELNLRRSKVTDSGIVALRGLKSLQRLDLRETPVTPKGVKLLHESLPDTDIHFGWDPQIHESPQAK
jgi:hypothetical protein